MKIKKVNILFFIYDRPDHTYRTITSILENGLEYINKIYVYVDGCDDVKTCDIQLHMIEVIKSTFKLYRFANYEIIRKSYNQGIAKSITKATNEYCSNNDLPFIVIEDDCVVKSGFFEFFTGSFEMYEKNEDIYTICGYQYLPDKKNTVTTELTNRFNPWGWGSWPHKWNFKWRKDPLIENEKKLIPESVKPFIGFEYLSGAMDIWSITVVIHQYLNSLYTVVPSESLVENIGFDGTGIHSEETDVFKNEDNSFIGIRFLNEIDINEEREYKIEKFLLKNLNKVMNKNE